MKISKHANCDSCELFKTCRSPWMRSHGAEEPLILVVGEAPGAEEDEQGFPFVGPSGRLLRDTLTALDFDVEKEVRFTNVVHCRPPDNKVLRKHINACEHYVLAEIEHYDPEVVLLMGNTPLSSILGERGITTWNGVVVEREDRTYVPLLHPAYVLRNSAAMDEWLEGFIHLTEALDEDVLKEDDGYAYIYPKTIGELEEMASFLAQYEWISYDVETTSLDYHFVHKNDASYSKAKVISASLAAGGKAYSFPIAHKDATWTEWEAEEVRQILQEVLLTHNNRVIGHNIKFDQQWTLHDLGIDFQPGGDTMLVSHLLDSRRGIHGLKRLAGLHLGMYDYDRGLDEYIQEHREAHPKRGGHYGNVPLDVLLPYGAMDAEATIRLHELLVPKLSDEQRHLYLEMIMPMSNVLANMEYNGHAIDEYIAQRYLQIYQMLQDEILARLTEHPDIQKTLDLLQVQADGKIFDSMLSSAYEDDLSKSQKARAVLQHGDITEERIKFNNGDKSFNRKRNIIEFNPNSSQQLVVLLYEIMKLPVTELTDTGNPSTAEDVIKGFAEEYPIVGDIIYYKMLTKAIGTYLAPAATGGWTRGDGRVSSTYNLHGTVTGRLSSSDPNMQNIPTPEKRPGTVLESLPIKNIFTHRWGYHNNDHRFPKGLLVATDYSGMELRCFASAADCEPMLEIHRSGVDFHTMVASMISGIPYDDITKPVRYIYKWTNWTLLYGGDEYTLHSMYGIPLEEAKAAIKEYYRRFPEVVDYQEWCVEFATTRGYIQSPYGRREYLHYLSDTREENRSRRAKDRRSAMNMPIQSAASDTLNFAAIVIHETLRQEGMETRLVNIVHDEIVADVPMHEVDRYVEIAEYTMENITTIGRTRFPSIDFSWLKSPLKAEAEVGTHHGVKIPYTEFVAKGRTLA